jgi:DNA-binding MarR family transcriptional regulator/GNAT superfamily N-acetyltransferase
MAVDDVYQCAEAVRRFNRFYTKQMGVLNKDVLKSPFSMTEARVIYELALHETTTATELSNELELNAGYLSRILRSFAKRGLIDKKTSETDGRQSLLWLTEEGQGAFATLIAHSRNEIGATLGWLSREDQTRLVKAMDTIERLLGPQLEHEVPYLLRPHRPGDMGWVVHRHGVLYAEEYGWDEQFEALVADIVAKFIQQYDPKWERCWIAEMDGENVGSAFVVRQSETVAKLRLMLVEPKARGLGIGKMLLGEAIRFAQQVGYQKMTLWTNNVLLTARNMYRKAGFQLVQEEPHHSFGANLIGETWELEL